MPTLFLSKFNPFPNKPLSLHVCSTSLVKTLWEKEKLLVTSNFSFSHSVLYPYGELSAIGIKILNCCLQSLSVWKSLKFAFWERLLNDHSIRFNCLNRIWWGFDGRNQWKTSRECRARSDYTYVQANLALRSPQKKNPWFRMVR